MSLVLLKEPDFEDPVLLLTERYVIMCDWLRNCRTLARNQAVSCLQYVDYDKCGTMQ